MTRCCLLVQSGPFQVVLTAKTSDFPVGLDSSEITSGPDLRIGKARTGTKKTRLPAPPSLGSGVLTQIAETKREHRRRKYGERARAPEAQLKGLILASARHLHPDLRNRG